MLCSKCKIYSIHLPNYDSYICEFGHILCRRCSDKLCNRCTICNGRIVRQTEFILEGIPKTTIRTVENSVQKNDVETYMKANFDGESVGDNENISQLFDFLNDESVTELKSEEILAAQRNSFKQDGIGDNSSSIGLNVLYDSMSRNELNRKEMELNSSRKPKRSRSICRFTTPSDESLFITPVEKDKDAKEYFSCITPRECQNMFDYKDDYSDRYKGNDVKQVFKQPDHLVATDKSSSKLNFVDSVSDSNTVLKHLNEFRKATNYIPPSTVKAYKIDGNDKIPDPTIITTSKSCIPRRVANQRHPRYCCSQQKTATSMFFPNEKVDVGTAIDSSFVSSSSDVDQDSDFDDSKRHERNFSMNTATFKPIVRNPFKSPRQFHPEPHIGEFYEVQDQTFTAFINQNPLQSTSYESYKNLIDTKVPNWKADYNRKDLEIRSTSPQDPDLRNIPESDTRSNITYNAIRRREELIQKDRVNLRQKIMQQIYSQFEKTSDKSVQIKEISTNIETDSSTVKNTQAIDLSQSKLASHDLSLLISGSVNYTLESKNDVALSTESYPKLNPNLAILTGNVAMAKKSSMTSLQSKSVVNDSAPGRTCVSSSTMGSSSSGKDKSLLNEISEQFRRTDTQDRISEIQFMRTESSLALESDAKLIENEGLNLSFGNTTKHLTSARVDSEILPPSKFLDKSSVQEMDSMDQNHIGDNSYFFHTIPEYTFPNTAIPIGGNDKSSCVKKLAKALMEDYRDEPKNHLQNGDFDINKFVKFLRERFPKISMKELKGIVLHLPNDLESLEHIPDRLNPILPDISVENKISDVVQPHSQKVAVSDITTKQTLSAFRASIAVEFDPALSPPPQFQLILPYDIGMAPVIPSKRIPSAADFNNMPRNPIMCPISTCKKLSLVSEFSKHVKVNHVKIPVESMTPGKFKNLFLDPHIDHNGVNKCHIMYLVTDKIRDLGRKEYKDFLPVLVMSTKVSLLELLCSEYRPRSKEVLASRQHYLMIWLTGLNPSGPPIFFSLTAWTRQSQKEKCYIVHSGQMYSIRNSQDCRSLFRSGQALLLSQDQCRLLTANGRNMIELQVVVH